MIWMSATFQYVNFDISEPSRSKKLLLKLNYEFGTLNAAEHENHLKM